MIGHGGNLDLKAIQLLKALMNYLCIEKEILRSTDGKIWMRNSNIILFLIEDTLPKIA